MKVCFSVTMIINVPVPSTWLFIIYGTNSEFKTAKSHLLKDAVFSLKFSAAAMAPSELSSHLFTAAREII